ncbi:MAG TPA: phenylalanine--tRNA ligase subunit alpha, partial [Spirochaetota bacterium]|nr:phenylalanine--tRNA ligase subunit alpha [Spirochaetota bacterium]
MENLINDIKERALEKLKSAKDSKTVEDLKVFYLGKKGELTSVLKSLGTLSSEERPKIGAMVNDAKNFLEKFIEEKLKELKDKELNDKFLQEKIDITLPGRLYKRGARHPIKIVMDEIESIFLGMGFDISEGPEVETDFNNFKSMNFQDDHPARDAQDTFYINDKTLLRTHTSPVQARTMQKMKPNPIRTICPGRVFRKDDIDVTHHVQFHQVEGLLVDKDVKL